MPDVLLAYGLAALLVAIVLVAAFALRSLFARVRFLNLVGLFIAAVALLEKGGWSAHHWTLGSPAATFDDLLFRILLLVGVGILFVAQLSR
jgi:hypothetical protein